MAHTGTWLRWLIGVGGVLLVATPGMAGPATAVAAGFYHTCAVTSGGRVSCWGLNTYGQLGDGTTTNRLTPVAVSGLASGVTAVAGGISHTCALTSGGGVVCWGWNASGQLGDGTTTQRLTPGAVSGLSSGVTAVAAGNSHTCALTSGGGVSCWGYNGWGSLGDGTTANRLTPVAVSGLSSGVTAVAAGQLHTCAVTSVGAVSCWGLNTYGQLGDNTTTQRLTPVAVIGLSSGVAAVAAGASHTCALTSGGAVWCWGNNNVGQLGDNTTTERRTPGAVSGLSSGVTAVAAGNSHTCALTSGGGVFCWGYNGSGSLGDGTTTQRLTPVAVSGLASGVTAIAAGDHHTCALTSGGAVWCWGNNFNGPLGDGTTTSRLTPVIVRAPGDFNGDWLADVAVYRPATGTWFIKGQGSVVFGAASDIPVPGDYDNDGTTDVAVFRPSTGQWFVRNQPTVQWGASGDLPVPADYNGDGQTDVAVFRPGTGWWYVQGQFSQQWGAPGDIPVAGHYNGDSRAEIAVYRPSDGTWYVSGQAPVLWGAAGDIPVPADYTGDGVLEIAVYRPSTGAWYIRGGGTYAWGGLGDMPVPQDLTGDGGAELVVYRPDTGVWYSYTTATGATTAEPFGAAGDSPVLGRPGARWFQRGDADGDRRADPTVFRPSTGTWFSLRSSSGLVTSTGWGASGDVPVPGDYRGVGRTQAAVFRPSTGTWHVNGLGSVAFGTTDDLPIPADYDGDGRTDVAVFRPSTGAWYVRTSSSGFTAGTGQTWGASGDVPVPGDYDGDRRADVAVFRPSTGLWYVLRSSSDFTTSFTQAFGTTGDLPVVGDYDGDGRADVAVFRPSTGTWFVRYSSTTFTTGASTVFGASGDTPVPADYDGDGRADLAVYRGSNNTWYVLGQYAVGLGTSGDIPVLKQP